MEKKLCAANFNKLASTQYKTLDASESIVF